MNEGNNKDTHSTPAVSRILPDRQLVELVYNQHQQRTYFAVSKGDQWSQMEAVEVTGNERLVPIPASNNLIRHQAILLPESPAPYSDVLDLLSEVRTYLARYVELPRTVQHIVSYY